MGLTRLFMKYRYCSSIRIRSLYLLQVGSITYVYIYTSSSMSLSVCIQHTIQQIQMKIKSSSPGIVTVLATDVFHGTTITIKYREIDGESTQEEPEEAYTESLQRAYSLKSSHPAAASNPRQLPVACLRSTRARPLIHILDYVKVRKPLYIGTYVRG